MTETYIPGKDEALEQAGFGIRALDASLAGQYPVMCVLLQGRAQGLLANSRTQSTPPAENWTAITVILRCIIHFITSQVTSCSMQTLSASCAS